MPKKTSSTPVKKKTPSKKKVTEQIKDGVEIGNYSTTVYQNGEKISFDIDWNRLREYMQTV